jgi:protein-S-isoprenylcysteine O-methyltransferase Ste14
MVVIVLQVLGTTAFVAGTLVLGVYLRRHPTKQTAEKTSRISHGLYWVGLVLPGVVGIFYPGLANFDENLGLPSLPARPVALGVGIVAVLIGLALTFASQVALRRLGEGTNAFWLTQRLVMGNIYARTRNPMSLGYYLLCVGIGLIAGSTYITLGSVLGVVPAHLFNLLYFEEYELALRLGPSYLEYKQGVPFLVPRLGSQEAHT